MSKTIYLLEQGRMLGELLQAMTEMRSHDIDVRGHHNIPVVADIPERLVTAESMQKALVSYLSKINRDKSGNSVVVAHIERDTTLKYTVELARLCLGVIVRYPGEEVTRPNLNLPNMMQEISSHPNVHATEYRPGVYIPWVIAKVGMLYGFTKSEL